MNEIMDHFLKKKQHCFCVEHFGEQLTKDDDEWLETRIGVKIKINNELDFCTFFVQNIFGI